MQESTRNKMLIGAALLLVVFIAGWWYSGFSLDFMRFFAAEPGVTDTDGRPTKSPVPSGCYYQEVQCIQAPCNPVLVCPSGQPTDRAIVQCAPTTQTVKVGGNAVLTAQGGSGGYQWFAPDGKLNDFGPNAGASAPGTANVVYDTPGTKKVTVQSGRTAAGGTDRDPGYVDSVACTVIVEQ